MPRGQGPRRILVGYNSEDIPAPYINMWTDTVVRLHKPNVRAFAYRRCDCSHSPPGIKGQAGTDGIFRGACKEEASRMACVAHIMSPCVRPNRVHKQQIHIFATLFLPSKEAWRNLQPICGPASPTTLGSLGHHFDVGLGTPLGHFGVTLGT